MIVADKINIKVYELNLSALWLNSKLGRFGKKKFFDLYMSYTHNYFEVLHHGEVSEDFVDYIKLKLISYLVKKCSGKDFTSIDYSHICVEQKQQGYRWKKFKIQKCKKSKGVYFAKTKSGLVLKIKFDVDEDVELDRQIKEVIDYQIDWFFPDEFEGFGLRVPFTSAPIEERERCIAELALVGLYYDFIDDSVENEFYEYEGEYIERIIDNTFGLGGWDWRRQLRFAQACGSWTGFNADPDEWGYAE
jgi:hypothetical protein